MFIFGWGWVGLVGCCVVVEEVVVLLEVEEVLSVGLSFFLMIVFFLMMWYKMVNKDFVMCGLYLMGNFCFYSCCMVKKVFCKDNMYLIVNLWIVYVSFSKWFFVKRCKFNCVCRLYN